MEAMYQVLILTPRTFLTIMAPMASTDSGPTKQSASGFEASWFEDISDT